jgi:single-stranded DNA-binding protein
MASDGKWVTLTGVVQFDPERKTIESLGQEVYEFSFRCAATQRRIKATLWGEHASLFGSIEKGDAVIIDGNLKTNDATNQSGDAVTYYNLSVAEIAVIAKAPKDVAGIPASAPTAAAVEDGSAW